LGKPRSILQDDNRKEKKMSYQKPEAEYISFTAESIMNGPEMGGISGGNEDTGES